MAKAASSASLPPPRGPSIAEALFASFPPSRGGGGDPLAYRKTITMFCSVLAVPFFGFAMLISSAVGATPEPHGSQAVSSQSRASIWQGCHWIRLKYSVVPLNSDAAVKENNDQRRVKVEMQSW